MNSLESVSGSSVESDEGSLGSDFYLEKLNALTMDRVLLTQKKLYHKEDRRESII